MKVVGVNQHVMQAVDNPAVKLWATLELRARHVV
jgi:hypothetical protein